MKMSTMLAGMSLGCLAGSLIVNDGTESLLFVGWSILIGILGVCIAWSQR